MVAAGGLAPALSEGPDSIRQAMVRLARAVDVRDVPVASVEDRHVRRDLPIRVYTPRGAAGRRSGAIVFFHGGVGVFGDLDTHDGLCRMLADSSDCRVIAVGYRLAPEHPFPAALDDAAFVVEWVWAHASDLLIERERIAVAGDSAGGTLAAVVCQGAARTGGPPIALQLLLCPVTDVRGGSESRATFAEGFFIDQRTLEWGRRLAYPPGVDLDDPRVSPLRAPDFSALPPAHIHTAEFDPMRDEGKAYADALLGARVGTVYRCHGGMIHHFYCMAGAIPRARVLVHEVGAAAGQALRGG